jgi:methylenetetrahydrofolate reductase (NADPH)
MKIRDLYRGEAPPVLSLEVFPPSRSYPLETVFTTLDGLRELDPAFISVTYGAASGERERTVEIASRIQEDYPFEPLAHLTCLGQSREEIGRKLDELHDLGIENVLALRGDPPEDDPDFDPASGDYMYASNLIEEIRRRNDFGIVAAAYPEGHVECPRVSRSHEHLMRKVDAGAEVLITQLFFDNRILFDFLERIDALGISVPVVPGIMPVLNSKQIRRIIYLCGVSIPATILRLLDRFGKNPEDMEKAGIDYAVEQVSGLLESGVPGVHLYTMNRIDQISEIARRTGLAGTGGNSDG